MMSENIVVDIFILTSLVMVLILGYSIINMVGHIESCIPAATAVCEQKNYTFFKVDYVGSTIFSDNSNDGMYALCSNDGVIEKFRIAC